MPLPWPDLPRPRIRYTHSIRDQKIVSVRIEKNLRHDTHLDDILHRKRRLETCVYLSTGKQKKNQRGSAEKRQCEGKSSHRVVVCLEKFAQSIGGFGVHRETTEEVNEILVAHAGLDQLKCALL